MRHLDLFSGIGGFALAASKVWGPEHEVLSFCEIEPFPQKVLKKHWPNVPCCPDIKKLRGDQFGAIDLITGGWPCQPFSVAGKQAGSGDDRHLWPEVFRLIQETRASWIIGENVAGFVRMELDNCIADLESEGYEVQAFVIPACADDAPHRRDRVWIVANSKCAQRRPSESTGDVPNWKDAEWEKAPGGVGASGKNGSKGTMANSNKFNDDISGHGASEVSQLEETKVFRDNISDSNRTGLQASRSGLPQKRKEKYSLPWDSSEYFKGHEWALTESPVCGTNDGISNRVDRLKGLGNAIVPQVAMVIMEAIKTINTLNQKGNNHGQ